MHQITYMENKVLDSIIRKCVFDSRKNYTKSTFPRNVKKGTTTSGLVCQAGVVLID